MANNNIEKQLKEISERLEQGVKEIFTSERYTEYLDTMSKFHNYSFNNTLLITMQKPEATLVAGYQAWQKKFNRHVKRGEKGIQIIAPAPIREKQEIEKIDPVTKEPVIGEDGQPETEIVEMVIPRFRVITVFDVSQTEGEPIADLDVPELTGSVQFYDTFMQALQNISPVPIRMMNVEGEAKGYYHQTEKYIAIQEDMSNVQTMKTGVHEVSHALLHDREVMDAEGVLKDRTTKEVEAESIAYIVCNHFGLDTSEYSFTYIASWCESKDMKALRASMDTIRKTSAEIIGNIETQMHEIELERPIRETFHREDVILHLSGSMGSEYSYDLVENMTVEQLQENIREYVSLLEQEEISEDGKSLEEFLEDRGATITPLYASDGVGENYPIDFFDVEYDADTGITYFSELTPKEQAEMLVEKAEFPRMIFTEEEKAFVTEYAETFPGQVERLNDLVWDMRESYDEAGTNLVHEVIQAARANFPTTELSEEKESTMQYAHRMIEAAETASHENFTESQRNLIVNFAYKMDDRNEVLGLVNRMITANRGDRSEVMRSLVHETEAQIDNFPDGMIGFTEMHEAGIRLEHMYPLEKNRAVELYREGAEVFILHGNPDYPEQAEQILAETENAILGHDGIFGITETEWEVHKEREATAARQEKWELDSTEKINETLLFHGESGRFAIYQMDTGGEHTYQFMGFESAQELGYTIEGKDYKMTIQHSKDLLQAGEIRATSEIGRDEAALNGLSRAEVERGVLYHAQGILEDMGLENEVELLAARVHGSRSREELYRDDSDLDVVLSYRGNIREDSFFNELNAHGMAMAGIKVDINPIAEERITLAEYMKESEAYLDQKEIEKLAVDLDNFSYEYDPYEYKDTVEDREEQVGKITEDILNQKTECLKDWLVEVSEESDIDSDVITARSLLSRLENAETLSIFTRQPEQEQPEATITFYVAECMEFPVMGEYHNNLTLEEAIKIYESIPAERMHGGKGIGFDLQDGDEDYSGEYELMCWDRVDRELIDMIPHYRESPLVQKAINDMEKYLNEKHGKVQEAEQTVEVKQEVSEVTVKKESVSVEPNQTQKKEPAKGEKGEVKKSVLQSLKDFQARAKAQEQKNKEAEKSKAHKKGDVEL